MSHRTIEYRRLRAVLALRGTTFECFARSLGVATGHLRLAIAGYRPLSARLEDELKTQLGPDWAFVTSVEDRISPGR